MLKSGENNLYLALYEEKMKQRICYVAFTLLLVMANPARAYAGKNLVSDPPVGAIFREVVGQFHSCR